MTTDLLFDEINSFKSSIAERAMFARGAEHRMDANEIEDEILDLLIMSFVFGTQDADEMLGSSTKPDLDEMKSVINRPIDGKTFRDRVKQYVTEYNTTGENVVTTGNSKTPLDEALGKIAETESHRIYNEQMYSVAQKNGAKRKTWNTMSDERVRDTHSYLNGTTVDIDAEFYTYNGHHTKYPGQFAEPEEDINCRCWLTYSKD